MSDVPASVLVVDDNPGKRMALLAALAPLGLDVVEAESGGAGLRALLAREFAVVLLDINLPDMDGYEVAELLRARPASAHTPILYITAERETELDLRRGYPYRVEEAAKALNCGHFTGDAPDCYVCVPLSAQGEIIGMLHVQSHPDAHHASGCNDAELNLIKAAAQHLALALANLGLQEKLIERATRDNLTSLYNRHYMLEWFEQELQRAARYGRSIGMIMFDVDHFKRVNDGFGHTAGDMVLRELAGVIRRVARGSDVACRHGGEEFLLLMPEATLEGTLAKAEELRQEVARLALAYEGQSLGSITVSAGVAMYPEHATTADTLLRRADDALYAAKEGGRNRVVVSGEEKR